MVRHFIPETLGEALDILSDHACQIMAGGTDLMVQKRTTAGVAPAFANDVLYIQRIKALKEIVHTDEMVRIGSACPLEEILHDQEVPKLLRDAIMDVASPAIRHMATLGGNIGNASPAGDTLVPLYVLDARVVLSSKLNSREVLLADMITGVRKTVMREDEMITEVIIFKHKFQKSTWVKVGGRRANAISKVSFAGVADVNDGVITDIRMAFGAVSPTVVRSLPIEGMMIGKTKETIGDVIREVVLAYDLLIHPIDDQRSNQSYRKQVALNLMTDFIKTLF
ncbi:MAG: FAD binding domain-containing protein [Acholeplasmataceae bacterium]|nr:FAD binding domain-containing protein [Acholeplasmataceae bacterium]